MTDRHAPTQPERTALSEQRTGAGILVMGLALMRAAYLEGSIIGGSVAGLAVGIAVLELWLSRRGYAERAAPQVPLPYPRAALAAATAVGLMAAAGLLVGLT